MKNKYVTTNIIEGLFCIDDLLIDDKNIITIRKKSVVSSFSLKSSFYFPVYEEGFLTETLIVKNNSQITRFKLWKSHRKIELLLDSINQIVATNISSKVLSSFDIFTKLVFHEYPRDSYIDTLNSLYANFSNDYIDQKHLWNKYLTDEVLEKYQSLISYYPIDLKALRIEHENVFLKTRKKFFDVVESNPLTEEQRLGVLRSNDRNMVLAAAGTGKTSIIVAKVLDLIDRKLADSDEILVLAYNKSATKELEDRLFDKAESSNITFNDKPQISTFHALGKQLVNSSGSNTYLSKFAEDEKKLNQWITDWLQNYLKENRSLFNFLISFSVQEVNPFDFATKADYEKYISNNEFRTLNHELVKGYQELLIANFLFENQIPYEYEAQYPSKQRIEIGFDYQPDFHIKGTNIYIEHFGVDRSGGTRAGINADKYNEKMAEKRLLHKEYGTNLIETFHYEWCEDNLLSGLEKKLADNSIKLIPMSGDDLFKKLNKTSYIKKWTDILNKSLKAIRVERLSEEDIKIRLANAGIKFSGKTAKLLESLHQDYISELNQEGTIDFDDMIIKATKAVSEERVKPKWKYILVDEFQDISVVRMELIQELIKKGPDPSLTVVGDDWQSIYRFSGGKLELMTCFGELIGSYTETKLQKTFRYNNSIANTAGQFIMENPEQFKKSIKTHSKVSESQVFLLDDKTTNNKASDKDGIYKRVVEIVKKIRENDASGSIAVIARYNYLIGESRQAIKAFDLQENVEFWTFHGSKGLEADYCILIGFFQGKSGFPNENKEEAIVEALLPSLDEFPHSEERRLLYVGITRAKHKSYIIADPKSPSQFINELLSPKYELNIVSQTFKEEYKEIFKCPNCVEGYLRMLNGKFGNFYVCSSGLGCDVGKARICKKCFSPSIDNRNESICNNSRCREEIKTCEKCGRPMKMTDGKYGQFWGCTGYAIKSDMCKNTQRL